MMKFKQFMKEQDVTDITFDIVRNRKFGITKKQAEKLGVPPENFDAHESDINAFQKVGEFLHNKKLSITNRQSSNVIDRSYGSVYDKVLYGGKEKLDRMFDIKHFRKFKDLEFIKNYNYGLSGHRLGELDAIGTEGRKKFYSQLVKDRPQTSDLKWFYKTLEIIKNMKHVVGR